MEGAGGQFNHGGGNETRSAEKEREEILLFHNNPFRSTKPKIVLSSISQTSVTSTSPPSSSSYSSPRLLPTAAQEVRTHTHSSTKGGSRKHRVLQNNLGPNMWIVMRSSVCGVLALQLLDVALMLMTRSAAGSRTDCAPQINKDNKDRMY